MNQLLVVGVGNTDRGDDAAGILAARRVAELAPHRCRVVECTGSLTALLDLLAGARDVVVVDAMLGEHPGRWHRLDAAQAELAHGGSHSTHGFGVGEVIGLARALGSLPESLTVYAVEASGFAHGSVAAPAVALAADEVARRIAAGVRGGPRGGQSGRSLPRPRRTRRFPPRPRSARTPHAA